MKYDDIIELDEPPLVRRRMLQSQRAAQFAPFAALTGYESLIHEKGRMVEAYRELDEQQQNELDHKLKMALKEGKEVLLTYFVADLLKDGGRYLQERVVVAGIDELHQLLILRDGRKIPLTDIYDLTE
jgi:hypothetical protein